MTAKCYINGMASITAQSDNGIFPGEIRQYHDNIFPAVTPDYKAFIPAMQLRRMSEGIKMGLTAAKIALKDAGIDLPDAIITGTGEGCKQNTDKFLQTVLDQEEELLSPTAFIQSTHNSVGGQIALDLRCTGYNMTYSQGSASLESAFIDAQLLLLEDPGMKSILVGGVDEISSKTSSFQYLDGQIKKAQISNLSLFRHHSPGTIISEGAQFFSISAHRTATTYAQLTDVMIFQEKESELVSEKMLQFLKKNKTPLEKVSAVILGNNGDSRYDHYYHHLQNGIFSGTPHLAYKHLTGEYNTVSGAAVWAACTILKNRRVPDILKLNSISIENPGIILIYNQYLGENHSLFLINAL